MKKLIAFVFGGLFVVSCCNCYKGTERSQTPITGDPWRLVQMDGRVFEFEGDGFVLTFGDDGLMTGKGSCNRLSGTFRNDNSNGTLSFGGVVATRMMCPRQEDESRFLRLLGEVDGYTIDGNMLMLISGGEQKLMLERVAKE